MSNRKIGNLNVKTAIKLLEFCEDDLSRLAKMIAMDVSRDSFLYRKAASLGSQITDLIEYFEKFQDDR
jgi:hypothetical protein